MVAHQPKDCVWPVLTARHRRIAGSLLLLRLRQPDLRIGDVQPPFGVCFRLGDFLACELAGQDRIEALDALRGVAVSDCLDLQRVQTAELRDLVERQ